MVLVKLALHTSARKPCVWICINKELHLKQVSDVLRVEHEDALEQDHIGRIHCDKLVFPAMTHSVCILLMTACTCKDGVPIITDHTEKKNPNNKAVVAHLE